ncbi:MAG TPA: hypothetical protein VIO64_10765 [Pseudobacteroides sp.]|uniref:hypothetical protein n=1 Tax=Pseudobacteroides sp. TaxID=1968840 RepID=UPI002F95A7FA
MTIDLIAAFIFIAVMVAAWWLLDRKEALNNIKVLQIKEGDTIVVRTRNVCSKKVQDEIQKALDKHLETLGLHAVKTVVIDKDIDIDMVLRKGE